MSTTTVPRDKTDAQRELAELVERAEGIYHDVAFETGRA